MSCVLANLESEWCRVAHGSAGRRALLRWGLAHPVLRGAGDLGELLEQRRDSAAAPAILAALAALAPSDDLAARTLLQALLPGLVRLAGTAGHDHPGAIDELVSLAWERIRTYPLNRPGPVAGNIVLDVRKRYRRHHLVDARWVELGALGPDLAAAGTARPAEDEALDQLTLRQHLAALAAQRELMGDVGFRAVVRTLVLGLSLAELAAEENVAVNTAGQRRWRALQRAGPLSLAG